MKLLYLGNEDMRKEGAGKVHFFEVAKNLNKIGYEVTMLIPGYYPISKENLDFRIVYIPTFKKSTISYLIFEFLKIFYMIWFILIKKNKVVYSRSALLDVMPAIITFITRCKYYTERNGIIENEMRVNGYSSLYISLIKCAEWINCKLSNGLICVTKGVADYYADEYRISREKVYTVANGTDTNKFLPLDQVDCRNKVKISSDSFIVGFVGTFAKWQHIDLLIDAAKIIDDKKYNNIEYVLVGDGSEYKNILDKLNEYGITDKFSLTGKVPHDLVPTYICSFNLCYLCKHGLEGGFSPLKMYEYLSCARPVLANKVSGIEEFIRDNNCGILFESNNARELADNIIACIDKKLELKQMGENGRAVVEKNHSWQYVARQLHMIMSEEM